MLDREDVEPAEDVGHAVDLVGIGRSRDQQNLVGTQILDHSDGVSRRAADTALTLGERSAPARGIEHRHRREPERSDQSWRSFPTGTPPRFARHLETHADTDLHGARARRPVAIEARAGSAAP
jgi:hypothetical protein